MFIINMIPEVAQWNSFKLAICSNMTPEETSLGALVHRSLYQGILESKLAIRRDYIPHWNSFKQQAFLHLWNTVQQVRYRYITSSLTASPSPGEGYFSLNSTRDREGSFSLNAR
jgi:hypothetical protein